MLALRLGFVVLALRLGFVVLALRLGFVVLALRLDLHFRQFCNLRQFHLHYIIFLPYQWTDLSQGFPLVGQT